MGTRLHRGSVMKPLLILPCLALCLLGCSASEDMSKAEAAVVHFHQQLDAGQYQAIYQSAAEEFKDSGDQARLVGFLEGVHGKLGRYKSGRRVNWRINYGTAGEMVTLDYHTEFENGQADEDFVFRIDGDTPLLVGYHVASNAFVDPGSPRRI